METEFIREFLVLAEHCNYRVASEKLFISQTALFKHIKVLEHEIGSPLFKKAGKYIAISEAGQMFLPYASQILRSVDQYMKEADEYRMDKTSVVLIGTQYRITDLISLFLRQDDRYLVRCIEGGEPEDFLYREDCELAFVTNLEDPDGKYESIPYTTDSLAVIMSQDHPLAKRERIALSELRTEKFVTMPSPKIEDDLGIRLCQQAGFFPRIVMTAAPGSEVARLAGQGTGVALLNKNVVQNTVKNAVAVDLDPPVEYTISLCWRRDVKLSDGARAFIEFIKNRKESG